MKAAPVTYDIERIKSQLPSLSAMLARDGLSSRKAGTAMFFCCPFHEEKTPSCQVDDDKGRFHCFGCGAKGDIFDYWQRSRGHSFQESLAHLAGLAGVGPATTGGERRAALARTPKAAVPDPDPLTGGLLSAWQDACERLANDSREIARIAEWRGIAPECVAYAAGLGLIGSLDYMGERREAFLVEMPTPAGLMPVSAHIRLAPFSRGNDRAKASWRFDPRQCGAWPFLLGDPASADHIFLLEGQWDVLALVSAMGWHQGTWPRIAVIGLRGASSGAKLLLHTFNPKASLFAFADSDGAGDGWFEEDGLLASLHPRVRAVHAFWPTTAGTDINDMVKSGELDRPTLLAQLQPLMADPRQRPMAMTFLAWCRTRTSEPAPIGPAAHYIIADKAKPKGRRPLRAWEAHWRKTRVPDDLFGDLALLWQAYRAEA